MQFQRLDWPEFASVVRELLPIYRPALAGDPLPAAADVVLREWLSFTGLPGWRCIVARTADRAINGFAMGHVGTPANSWHHLTRVALLRSGVPAQMVDEYLRDYFVLAEVHVSEHAQGRGIGARLISEVLNDWSGAVALTVREVDGSHPSRAWRLYRSSGFVPVARGLRLAGSSQRFAVMYRPPLDRYTESMSQAMAGPSVPCRQS